ncbi:hypothetical protein LTS18_010252, partial [Coniosporium uncinatum]
MTSYELLTSGVVEVLLEVFASDNTDAKTAFLEAFMGSTTGAKQKTTTSTSPATPFSVLVHKLQDLLSRSEHFEVITVHQNSFDSNRSSAASMLAKQLRLKLTADEDSGIPATYRNIMVTIHAIATFKSLDDYLRPRMAMGDRAGVRARREGVSSAIAAYAAALAGRGDPDGRRSALSGPPPAIPTPSDLTNRSLPKRGARGKPTSSNPQPSSSSTPVKPSTLRRSSRKGSGQNQPPPPEPQPTEPEEETLECADEAQLSDDGSMQDEAINAIVDDLEDEMSDEAPEPPAVDMEVAATGKVTARREDGTRVATPLGGGLPAPARGPSEIERARMLLQQRAALASTPTSSNRPMSYAAAIQAVPQDWHVEFFINDQPISNETTIYRAVHFNQTQPNEISTRNLWSAIHTIKYKKVAGPPPAADPNASSPPPDSAISQSTGHPASLDKNPITSVILRLLSILHNLNANIDEVISEHKETIKLNAEPLSQFVNTKLTAKMNRQLEEPLIVASNCLPNWSEDLARLYPFLFPFETRHLFLQSTSYGYSRSMSRWQTAQESSNNRNDHRHRDERPFMGRLQRQKVRIARSRILESGIKVLELYGSSPSILE